MKHVVSRTVWKLWWITCWDAILPRYWRDECPNWAQRVCSAPPKERLMYSVWESHGLAQNMVLFWVPLVSRRFSKIEGSSLARGRIRRRRAFTSHSEWAAIMLPVYDSFWSVLGCGFPILEVLGLESEMTGSAGIWDVRKWLVSKTWGVGTPPGKQ